MTKVELRDFDLLGDLDSEQDALESMYEYDGGYVCDNITEIADNYIPIYTHELWTNAYNIKEYIEEAIAQGLTDTSNPDIDSMFQSGYYQYYTTSLYNNLDTIAFNMIAKLVNEKIDTIDEDMHIDIEDIENAIEEKTDNFDNNNDMSSIEDIANEIIEEYFIEEEEEEEEEE